MRAAVLFAFFLALSSCGDDGGGGTSGDCDAADAPTYETFGRAFLGKYCAASCHASTLAVPDRNQAPLGYDFDSVEGAQSFAVDIDEEAGLSTSMPPSTWPTRPTDEERATLHAWIACGAP